jgi:hypothetical protein
MGDKGQTANCDLSVLILANDGSVGRWLAKLEELILFAQVAYFV